jgi:hypothetical protein
MPTRLRGVLAALALLATFVLAPAASATCGVIDAFVPSGKPWYSAADVPPTVLWDIVDDERSPKDFMNTTTGSWLVATPLGAFGFTAVPAWNTYAPGVNTMRGQVHCASGTQTVATVVAYDPIPPAVGWSLPAAGQWLRGTVTLRTSGSDSLSGVSSFSYALPNGTVSSSDGNASLDTTGAADGTLVLSAVSVDAVGNRSATATRVVRIDNGAPVVSIDAPPSPYVSSSSMTLAASSSDAQSGVTQVRFEGRAGQSGAWQALGSDGEAPYRLALATPSVEGEYEVRAISTDAIGNESSSAGSVRVIDRVAPSVALTAVPTAVSGTIGLSAAVTDAGSGVAHVEFEIAATGSDDWQTVGSDDAAPYAARLATTGLPDGAYALRALARDAAGNETLSALRSAVVRNGVGAISAAPGVLAPALPAGAAAAPAAAGKRRVTMSARALPHRVEGGHAIVVRGIAKGLSGKFVIVTLQNAHRPSLIQRVRAITHKNGSFRVSLRPRFSGRVRVRFAGDAVHRAAGADAGITRVHPRLIVSMTATRAANGSLENPHVRGRLVPAGGPVRVVWQARPAHGGAWLLFCRTADQLAVGRSGVIDGTCHVSGLNADNRYRLVVLGDAGASYLPARTAPMVARPTS